MLGLSWAVLMIIVAGLYVRYVTGGRELKVVETGSRVDHLVYGAPDLDLGIETLEKLLGVRATPGGRHPGRGTRNALIALGPKAYLEILAPDPNQPEPDAPRPFGLDGLKAPGLIAWSARGRRLEKLVESARKKGLDLGEVISGSRHGPGGLLVSWRCTTFPDGGDPTLPFLIDWGETPHPAKSAAPGASLIELRLEHPSPEDLRESLKAIGVRLPVKAGPAPALIATIGTARGPIQLR